MKKKSFFLIIISSFLFLNCCSLNYNDVIAQNDDHRIYLYGEKHGQNIIMQKELELWEDYYTNQGFRHLFLENGYCDAQMLNLWMKSDDDTFLQVILDNFKSTVTNGEERAEQNRWFYKEIKSKCPETIFHGTDVQHQWKTGVYYEEYLESLGKVNEKELELINESIDSCGKYYYERGKTDDVFRENYMVSNFKREFDALPADTKIMGIYGAQHIKINSKNVSNQVLNMVTQLKKYYQEKEGDIIFIQNIASLK